MSNKSLQIDRLKNERTRDLYSVHQQVVDTLVSGLAEHTDSLFEADDNYLQRLDTLLNTYSILGGIMKMDHLLWYVDELRELKDLSSALKNRQKLRTMELLCFTKNGLKECKEVRDE